MAVSLDACTSLLTLGKLVTGTETLNEDCETAYPGDAPCLDKVAGDLNLTSLGTGKDAEGYPAIVDSIKTLYSSAVGVIGLGKLSPTNLTSILTTTCVMFE